MDWFISPSFLIFFWGFNQFDGHHQMKRNCLEGWKSTKRSKGLHILDLDKTDLFVPGWIKNSDWNSVIGWCSFSQPEKKAGNKLLSSSFCSLSQLNSFLHRRFARSVFVQFSFSFLFFTLVFFSEWHLEFCPVQELIKAVILFYVTHTVR